MAYVAFCCNYLPLLIHLQYKDFKKHVQTSPISPGLNPKTYPLKIK